MESNIQPRVVTLAHKLGEAPHFSPLLRKVETLSGCSGERLAQWLLKCAVQRGSSHYRRDFDPQLPTDNPTISNEELGVALCLPHHPFEPMLIRAAAQLLSSEETAVETLAHLAVMERCDAVFSYIAQAAGRIAPNEHPWASLRKQLPQRRRVRADAMPHWSRFVSQTGYTPAGRGQHIEWLTRDE